ncbi:MAG: hypothetical protein A2V86_01755 [Deltaproteobacteria bacterium RBG_16_49_23]|nr:MAG: hypothetical protein A2V86_01755 [Deltaproteobacteria bacterium RBG_16_49_23]
MLIIRNEQMDAFSGRMAESFVNSVDAHLKEFWPEKYEEMGEEAVRESIHEAMDTAREFGIINEYDMARYIDLIYEFDWPADEEPDTPWAEEILRDSELDSTAKMDRLYEEANRILEGNS